MTHRAEEAQAPPLEPCGWTAVHSPHDGCPGLGALSLGEPEPLPTEEPAPGFWLLQVPIDLQAIYYLHGDGSMTEFRDNWQPVFPSLEPVARAVAVARLRAIADAIEATPVS